ncbi:MAG: AAA family ATPase, partial [Thermodesulfobacteriota bacterium]
MGLRIKAGSKVSPDFNPVCTQRGPYEASEGIYPVGRDKPEEKKDSSRLTGDSIFCIIRPAMEELSKKQQILQDLKKFILSKASIVYIQSDEEDRVESLLKDLTATFQPKPKLFIWNPFQGLTVENEKIDNSKNPIEALDRVIQNSEQAFYLFEGLHSFFTTDLLVPRKLKDLHRSLRNRYATLFIVAPILVVPEELKRDMVVYELPMPDAVEVERTLMAIISSTPQASKLTEFLTPEMKDRLVKAALGLSLDQVARAFRSALIGRTTIDPSLIDAVIEEKGQLIRKSGILNLVINRPGLEDIGGLENLKDWLRKRSKVLSGEGTSFGLQIPKGVLITGLSGCGKSLCAKAFASFWHIPLLHLDMGRLYDGTIGEPEEALQIALRTSESVAPCVLWIDEIEAGISIQSQKAGGGSQSRVFASFLTWMQEKTVFVFIAATANVIELLPPEVLRKGRFDQIFFVTLPNVQERRLIFSIHLKKTGADLSQINLDMLVKVSEGFNGAEIEQAVNGAMIEAFNSGRKMNEQDLVISAGNIVPLSITMREEIGRMERWAYNRAIPA